MQRFGAPGKTMVGSDSHTCAAGSLGMLAIGVGGLEVALAIAGEPLTIAMPEIWGVGLTGELPRLGDRRRTSSSRCCAATASRAASTGSSSTTGPALADLTAMDRHVIANMGAELGATTTVFPADDEVRRFLDGRGPRGRLRRAASPTTGATYDVTDDDRPLDARAAHRPAVQSRATSSRCARWPGAGLPGGHRLVGEPGAARLRRRRRAWCDGRQTHERVSFDVNPTSRPDPRGR